MEIAVTTARLICISSSRVVAVGGVIHFDWNGVTAPTLLLVSNRIADELELLLPHVGVTCVHCPDSAAIVAGHINL